MGIHWGGVATASLMCIAMHAIYLLILNSVTPARLINSRDSLAPIILLLTFLIPLATTMLGGFIAARFRPTAYVRQSLTLAVLTATIYVVFLWLQGQWPQMYQVQFWTGIGFMTLLYLVGGWFGRTRPQQEALVVDPTHDPLS